MNENQNLLEDALRLQLACGLGLIRGDLSSEELEILAVLHRDQPILEAKLRADLIAASVSKLFHSDNQ